MTVRAKFTVAEIRRYSWDQGHSAEIILTPQYDESIPEDRRFLKATPSGKLAMRVDNPTAIEQLQLGRVFYLDLVPVDDQKPA